MKKLLIIMHQVKKLRDRAIRVEQLPPVVSRRLAADFACCSTRFLMRSEGTKLKPIIVGGTVHYAKKNLLKFLGIDE